MTIKTENLTITKALWKIIALSISYTNKILFDQNFSWKANCDLLNFAWNWKLLFLVPLHAQFLAIFLRIYSKIFTVIFFIRNFENFLLCLPWSSKLFLAPEMDAEFWQNPSMENSGLNYSYTNRKRYKIKIQTSVISPDPQPHPRPQKVWKKLTWPSNPGKIKILFWVFLP